MVICKRFTVLLSATSCFFLFFFFLLLFFCKFFFWCNIRSGYCRHVDVAVLYS